MSPYEILMIMLEILTLIITVIGMTVKMLLIILKEKNKKNNYLT